jgi:ADP-ribose pyrophosphatase YjhB (NUDIX family)
MRRTIGKIWKTLPRGLRLLIVRSTNCTFTVSSAAIVVNRDREVLLLDHVLRPRSGWGLPGGFLDAGEHPADALKRELLEETGLVVRDVRLYDIRTVGRHLEILFSARASEEPALLSREIYRLGWFSRDSIPDGLPTPQRNAIYGVLDLEV